MDNNVDVSADYFANSKQKIGSRVRIAHNYCDNKDLTRIGTKSHFARSIRAVFADIRPTKIIETGTYLGTGTTTIIARTLQTLNIRAIFYTIEINPDFYARAKKYIQSNKLNAIVLNGLSVPRSMLPTMEDIRKNTVTDIQYGDIFVDHKAESRAQLYYDETNFPNIDDDLLGRSLKALEYKPDFVLLDSAGHMGNIEFNYLVERLRGPCYIALDDIYHIKHHRSFKQIQNDPRFEVITASKEKFGFCIAKFTPNQTVQGLANSPSVIPVAAPVGKEQTGAPGKRKLTGISVAEFEEFLKNKVGTAENHRDVADALELLTPDQYLPDDIRMFRKTGNKDTNTWTPISTLNAISKNFKIDSYLEIGVRRGRSLCQMLFHSPDVDVYAFDLWIENYAGAENPGPEFVQSEMTKVGYKKEINFYNGDSGEILPKFFRDPGTPKYFDVIYVDGDHSYEGALKDLHNVIGQLKPGGILLFDDVNHPQHKYLAEVWDTIKAENPNLAYYGCDYGYGLRIALNNQAHCSDGSCYINADDYGNMVGTGASVRGTTKAVSKLQSTEIAPRVSAESLSSKKNRRVLIIRPDSIGDFIIFSGVLRYFRKLYSNAEISLLVQKNIAELAQSCPHIDEVIPFDRNLAESDWSYLNTLTEQLRARKFDIAINPVYSRTFLDDSIVLKSDAKEKIAFIGDDTNMDIGQRLLNNTYYDRLVPATDGLLIETKRNEEFIKGLGASVDGPCVPTIWLKPEDKDYIDSLLNELGVREPIVVCPFAQAKYRQWPIHKWAELLSHYQELPVLICGTNNDKNEADLLIDLTEHNNIHNICGKTNLRQLAALFPRSRLCIASESGTAHIAAAVDCPQVVIIGGGHFGRFMPYSSKTTLVHFPMDCYNCNWRCPFWRWEIYCITQVSVAKVDAAVREVLANPNPPDGRPRIFKDLLKINTASIVKPLTLHIKQDEQNKREEPSSSCWCGGNLIDSIHPLYGLCTDCATLVLKKKPTEEQVRELYSIDGYWHKQMSNNEYPQIEQRAISDFKDRIPVWYEVLIKHRAQPENLLEIGCAHGGFLHYCHQRGVNNVVGVEVDKRVCEFAHNYFNLPNIVCGLFPDVSLPFDKFDVIVGFDVIEHFTNPLRALKKIADILRDDGVCLFQIPCYRGESAEWVQFRPGEHIYLFNNESIGRLFDAGGLEVDEISIGYFTDDIFAVARRKKAAGGAASSSDKNGEKGRTCAEFSATAGQEEVLGALHNDEEGKYLVTAIISTYNSEDSIARCLQDLEEQTIADKLEIIIVNSGSQQNEESIVKAFQQKYKNIKYIRTVNRETIYKAWNRAIRMASGKYITNANTDDTHRRDALEILARALEENPDAVLAYANQGCIDKADGEPVKDFISGEFSRYRMLAEWCYISSHPMWRKDVHKEFGYFDETFVAAGDWEFWLRISQKYDFVYINEILGNRLWTEDCLSRKEFDQEGGLAITEAELIRKCYHYALETALVIDYRAISANPTFSSWPEVSLWKQKVQAKLSGATFNPENNIKNILDYRDKSTPRLSIVIVSYNNLSALQTNLSSLNEQTEDCFEVIVVNSGQIIPEPDWVAEQLKYGFCCVELKQNLGPSFAKNIGIKQARGEYVAFLDDDAIAEKNFAKHILRHFSNLEIYGLRGKVLPKDGVQLRHITPEFDLGEKIILSACEVGTNCAFRKDILDRVGGFNENLFGYEFQELSYRIFKANDEKIDSIMYLPDVIVYHNPPAKNLPYYVNQLQRRIGKKMAAYKWPGIENYLEFARIQYPHRQEKLEKDYKRLLNIGLFLHKRYPQEAVKWLEKAVALNPDEITSCHTLGSLYLRLERYNEAQVILEKILGPLEAALVSGDSPLSNVKFNNSSEIAYYFVSTCTKLAQCYIKQGNYDKIKHVYTNLLNNPDLPIPPELKSNIFNVLKKLDKTPPPTVIVEKQNSIATSAAKTENDYLVSAIVSTYNCEKFIRGCLEDLENQTIAERLEIIVVDSGSEENEESIVREFQQKYDNIKYIRTEHREGIYTAWNKAIKLAQGRFITNANTDDRHRKDALEVMAKELLANPDIALVYTDQIQTDTPNDSFDNHHGTEILQRPDYSRQRLLFGCCVGSQPMWRKSLHDEFGYFDESLTSAGDWDFWLRISSKYKFKHIHEPCGLYYYNKNGIEHGSKIHSLYERYIVGRRYGQPYIAVIPIYQNKDNPLVSFIMPAYNAGKYIADAIESVLIQNYRNFELIIVDDGSTDNTKEVALQYNDNRIKYIHKENGGVSGARNLAITQSKGQYIIPLDADDMMAPNLITLHLQEFEKHPDADLIYCDVLLIDTNGQPIKVMKKPEYQNHRHLIRDLFQQGHPIIPFRPGIRRSVFDNIGLYDETLMVAEDYDMMRRFVRAGLKEHHLRQTLHLRRMHPENLSRAMNPDIPRSHFEVIKRFTDTFGYDELFPDIMWDKIVPERRQSLAQCLIGATYLTIGRSYIKSNSPIYANQALDMAYSELNECLKIDPNNQLLRELLQKSELLRAKIQPDSSTGGLILDSETLSKCVFNR